DIQRQQDSGATTPSTISDSFEIICISDPPPVMGVQVSLRQAAGARLQQEVAPASPHTGRCAIAAGVTLGGAARPASLGGYLLRKPGATEFGAHSANNP
ncbi:MAG: hypothetical protein LC804_11970, partial [Acidobacteria bacterium]|nr:hypothetical protein [Acidobacteriota bacterium]